MKKIFYFPLLLLVAGCWDTHQAERMYYIHGLGIDYKDEQYVIHAQIVDFTNIAKSEQPNPDAVQAEVGVAKGKTFDEAFFNLYQSMDERLFFGHMAFVIFSENLAKENKIQAIVNSFIRYRELRYTTMAYITDSPLDEVMITTPIINKSITLSKLSDPWNSYDQSSLIRPLHFRELMIQLDEPSHEAKIPFVKLSENWSTDSGKDRVYKFSGVSVISKQSGFKGNLLDDDVRGIQWLLKDTKRTNVTIEFPGLEEKYVTITVDEIKPTIKPITFSNPIQFDIDVKLIVQANQLTDETQMQKMKELIERHVETEIENTFKAGLKRDLDIYRLSEVVYRKELKAWKENEKDGKIALTESSIRTLQVEVVKIKGERTTTVKKEEAAY